MCGFNQMPFKETAINVFRESFFCKNLFLRAHLILDNILSCVWGLLSFCKLPFYWFPQPCLPFCEKYRSRGSDVTPGSESRSTQMWCSFPAPKHVWAHRTLFTFQSQDQWIYWDGADIKNEMKHLSLTAAQNLDSCKLVWHHTFCMWVPWVVSIWCKYNNMPTKYLWFMVWWAPELRKSSQEAYIHHLLNGAGFG